jgi:hypothetical protein
MKTTGKWNVKKPGEMKMYRPVVGEKYSEINLKIFTGPIYIKFHVNFSVPKNKR